MADTPTTPFSVTIPPNSTNQKSVSGFYLRVVKAPVGTFCRINEMGGQFPVKSTFWLRSPDRITRIEFFNSTAADILVEYSISQDEVGDNQSATTSIDGIVSIEYSRQLSEIQRRNIAQGVYEAVQSASFPNARKYIIVNEGNSNIYLGNGGLNADGIAAGKYIILRPWDSFEMDVKGGFKLYAPDAAAVAKIVIINSL